MNHKTNAQKRAEIAQKICNSEAFARLMIGVNTVDRELSELRTLWFVYQEANGGYGKSKDRGD